MAIDKTKFLAVFKSEIQEHLDQLRHGLNTLESTPDDQSLLEEMRRSAHTLKGSSAMMGYTEIADLGKAMEEGFKKVLEGKVKLEKVQTDVLLKCVDEIPNLIENMLAQKDPEVNRSSVQSLCKEIENILNKTS